MDFALIVAGGTGSRMQKSIPKQFLELGGVPMLMRTIHAFSVAQPSMRIIVVLPFDQHDFWFELCHQFQFHVAHDVVSGGKTRFQSVKNGLDWITEAKSYDPTISLIAVHDGVRPLIKPDMITDMIAVARHKKAVVPGLEPVDSIRLLNIEKDHPQISIPVSYAVSRNTVRCIQTPQIFIGEYIQKAYQQEETAFFTDDASVIEKMGISIYITDGDPQNIKITRPIDLTIAMILLQDGQS